MAWPVDHLAGSRVQQGPPALETVAVQESMVKVLQRVRHLRYMMHKSALPFLLWFIAVAVSPVLFCHCLYRNRALMLPFRRTSSQFLPGEGPPLKRGYPNRPVPDNGDAACEKR